MKLTDMEQRVLKTIPKENFYECGFDSVLWVDCFLDTVAAYEGIQSSQSRAILTNLEKKELIIIYGEKKDKCLCLTDNGKKWLFENGYVDNEGGAI